MRAVAAFFKQIFALLVLLTEISIVLYVCLGEFISRTPGI